MNYERTMFYTEHIRRSLKQGFKALTPEQYIKLCDKIEGMINDH